jgi:hypothetical protein
MALTTLSTEDPERKPEGPLFGFLLAGYTPYTEAVGFKIEHPIFPPKERANTLAGIYVPPQHQSLSYYSVDETSGGVIRAIVYQPTSTASQVFGNWTRDTSRTMANLSDLRRRVSEFSQLPRNWDREGAEPVSYETAATALQILERIAIVLERKNTSSFPSVRAFPDGSVFFKWIRGQKELAITVEGTNIEVQRWEPLDAFQSQGLWEISVDATAEHVEWVLT